MVTKIGGYQKVPVLWDLKRVKFEVGCSEARVSEYGQTPI